MDGIPKDDSKLKCVRCDAMGHRKADCTKKFAELSRLDWRAPLFEPPQHWYRQSCAGLRVQQDGVQAAGVSRNNFTHLQSVLRYGSSHRGCIDKQIRVQQGGRRREGKPGYCPDASSDRIAGCQSQFPPRAAGAAETSSAGRGEKAAEQRRRDSTARARTSSNSSPAGRHEASSIGREDGGSAEGS